MYWIDSPTYGVDVFDYDEDSGSAGARRRFLTLPARWGLPDGLTRRQFRWAVDRVLQGWCRRRFTADGVLSEERRLPVLTPTSCSLGGADLRDLFITTSRGWLSLSELQVSM